MGNTRYLSKSLVAQTQSHSGYYQTGLLTTCNRGDAGGFEKIRGKWGQAMVSKKRQVVERPSGIGKIFKDEREIAKASYLLDMVQTMNIARTFTETTEIPGLKVVGDLG